MPNCLFSSSRSMRDTTVVDTAQSTWTELLLNPNPNDRRLPVTYFLEPIATIVETLELEEFFEATCIHGLRSNGPRLLTPPP